MIHPRGTVLQANGEPYEAAPRHLTTPFETELPASERRTVSQPMSPAYLKAIEQEANQGKPRNLINFAEGAREKDERIGMCAGRREGAVAALDWSVQPGQLGHGASDGQLDRAAEIAYEATGVLKRVQYLPLQDTDIGAGGFSDLIRHNESSTYYGVAPAWWEWGYVNGRWDPVRAHYVHPRRIVWDSNLKPRLYDPGAKGPQGTFPGLELDPLQWTIDLGQVRPGYPMRDGYARACIWLYAYSSFSWQDFIQYSEQFGIPFLLGYLNGGPNAQEGSDPKDKDRQYALQQVIKKFSGLKRAVIDGRDDIKALQVSANAKHIAPIELIRLTNECKAILFLGGTQAVDVGDHATQATSTTHQQVELRLVQHDAEHRSNTITGLLRKWHELNHADGQEYAPTFWMDADEPADLDAELERHKGIYELRIPQSKAEIYEKFGVSPPRELPNGEPDPDDVVVKPEAPANPFVAMPPEEDDEDDDGQEMSGRPRGPVALAEDPPADFDEDEASATFEGHAEEYVEVVSKAAKVARTDALDVATSWINDQSVDPGVKAFTEELASKLTPAYAKAMGQGKFRPIVEGIYEAFKLNPMGWPKGTGFDFGSEDLNFTDALGGLDKVHWSKYIDNPGSESSIKGFLEDWYGKKGGDLWGRMKPETLEDFHRAMGGQLKHLHDWQAKRIVNTSVARIRGYADVQQMVDSNVTTMQWFTTSGEMACEICGPLNGTQVSVTKYHTHMVEQANLSPDAWADKIGRLTKDHPIDPAQLATATNEAKAKLFEQVGYQAPIHPSCKCMLLAVLTAALAAMLRIRR